MTTQPDDTVSAWKRASGIWHYWAEKHFNDRKSNPFGRRPVEAEEDVLTDKSPEARQRPHEL